MIRYYQDLLRSIADTPLAPWLDALPQQITDGLCDTRFGDLPAWRQALERLPDLAAPDYELKHEIRIGRPQADTPEIDQLIDQQLRALIPWRKGPYQVFNSNIDTEWRSDWKWNRVLPNLAPLQGRTILDVGCGNGYHCWRMLGEGADRVIGIDPSPRFVIQFLMIKHFLNQPAIDVLPVGIEAVPKNLQAFDTTFSMGVLYHRRSPMDHLKELKETLKPGGQLVLETLVVDGERGHCLVPEGRYAMMNNVWFLPSCLTLESWLRKCGFKSPRLVDLNQTAITEQRQTDWMKFHSLANFLNPEDSRQTVEGHPAPKRAIFIAEV